eukprot:scaffold316716_cov19-Tisochrysis_lutea.AAC.1
MYCRGAGAVNPALILVCVKSSHNMTSCVDSVHQFGEVVWRVPKGEIGIPLLLRSCSQGGVKKWWGCKYEDWGHLQCSGFGGVRPVLRLE